MFCAFSGDALILRVYGNAVAFHPRDKEWKELVAKFPEYPGARNIFKLHVDLVTTSCGTGVPEMTVVRSRAEAQLLPWYADLGTDGVKNFWRKKNVESLDGRPTGIFKPAP